MEPGNCPAGFVALNELRRNVDAEKWEGATESRATIAPGRGPSHSRSTATDHDCRRFPVESCKAMFRTLHSVACSARRGGRRRWANMQRPSDTDSVCNLWAPDPVHPGLVRRP